MVIKYKGNYEPPAAGQLGSLDYKGYLAPKYGSAKVPSTLRRTLARHLKALILPSGETSRRYSASASSVYRTGSASALMIGAWDVPSGPALAVLAGPGAIVFARSPSDLSVWTHTAGERQRLTFDADLLALDCDGDRLLIAFVDSRCFLLTRNDAGDFIHERIYRIDIQHRIVSVALADNDSHFYYATSSAVYIGSELVYSGAVDGGLVSSPNHRWIAFRSPAPGTFVAHRVGFHQVLGRGSGSIRYHDFASTMLALALCNNVATIWVEIGDSFVPVVKKRDICALAPVDAPSAIRSCFWLTYVDMSGAFVMLAVDGLDLRPRPIVSSIVYFRIGLADLAPTCTAFSLISVACVFASDSSWENTDVTNHSSFTPQIFQLVACDADSNICSCSISVADRVVSDLQLHGGHSSAVRSGAFSPCAPFVATIDERGDLRLFRYPRAHPLASLERHLRSEALEFLQRIAGPVIDFRWHPNIPSLFVVKRAAASLTISLVSRLDPLSVKNACWSVTEIGAAPAQVQFVDIVGVPDIDTDVYFAATMSPTIILYKTEGLRYLTELCSIEMDHENSAVTSFAMGVYDHEIGGDNAGRLTLGLFQGFEDGRLVHRVVDFDPGGGRYTIRHRFECRHTAPVSSVLFLPECYRVVTHAADQGAVWEINPTLTSLNCIHTCVVPGPFSACSLGDGFARVITVSLSPSILVVSIYKPNRDHVLREHEFRYFRWQRDDVQLPLPQHIAADREVSAVCISPFGDVLCAIDNVVVFIASCDCLAKDVSTIVLPVQPYHPSFLTELLMTGQIGLASLIVAHVCQSTDGPPTISLPSLLDDYRAPSPVFSSADVATLTRGVTERPLLPFLTSPENVQLLAVAHTILELGDLVGSDVDLPGFRFIIAVRLFQFERRSHQSCQHRLEWVDVAWAAHSRRPSSLVKLALPAEIDDWKALAALGLGFWLDSGDVLRHVIETLAKTQFRQTRNALVVMPWYLALQKKSVFLGLLRSSTNQKSMCSFFSNDFTDPHWQMAAVKNAFEFISNRKFLSAVAMFLLAGRLSDAVTVCLRNMQDAQLAAVLVRLQPGAPPDLLTLIFEEVLSGAVADHDQWLQHIAYCNLNRRDDAIRCVMVPNAEARTFQPDVYNLLNSLHSIPDHADDVVANTIAFYAQRGWSILSLRLLKSLRLPTPSTFRQFLIRAAISASASCGGPPDVVKHDLLQLALRFGVAADPIWTSVQTFLRAHRLFAAPCPQLLHDAYATVLYSIDPDRVSTAYRHRAELTELARLCLAHPKSVLADALVLAASYLVGWNDPVSMVDFLHGRHPWFATDPLSNLQSLEAALRSPALADLPPKLIESPFSDQEIIDVVESVSKQLTLVKFLQLFKAQCLGSPSDTDHGLVFALYSKFMDLLRCARQTVRHRVQRALEFCAVLARSGIGLDDALAPLRTIGGYSPVVQSLLSVTDAKRVLSMVADDIDEYCSLALNGEYLEPVEIFRAANSAVQSVALDRTDQMHLVVAHRRFLREINIESSLRFRIRTQESHELADYEYSSWEGCYHRFDNELERLSTPLDPYVYPAALHRADLASALPALDADSPKPLGERFVDEDPLYRRLMSYNASYKSSASINTESVFQRVASHPSLPLFVTGSDPHTMHIWKFGNPFPIGHIDAPDFHNFACLRFEETSLGACFAAASSNGRVSVFAFAPEASVPLFSVRAHHRALAAEFVGCATRIATGGAASQKRNSDILLWDLLCPSNSPALSFSAQHDTRRAYTSLAFVAVRNQLVAGSLSGDLCAFDLRIARSRSDPIWQFRGAHASRLKCAVYDRISDYLVTGDANGCVRIWNVRAHGVELVHDCGVVFQTARPFGTLLSTPTSNTKFTDRLGVTSLSITNRGDIVCAGSGGSVKYIKSVYPLYVPKNMENIADTVADQSVVEYLKAEVSPILLPVLILLEKMRPANPIEFLAVELIRRSKETGTGTIYCAGNTPSTPDVA